MFHYYIIPQTSLIFRFEENGNETKFQRLDTSKNEWLPYRIIRKEKERDYSSYEIDPQDTSTTTLTLRVPAFDLATNDLMLTMNNRWFTLTKTKLSPELQTLYDNYKIRNENPSPQTTKKQEHQELAPLVTYAKKYTLSEEQKQALRQHRQKLENRWFDYRILSYLFRTGYSRTEKINEITQLLENGTANAEVVEQGRTGDIVLKR